MSARTPFDPCPYCRVETDALSDAKVGDDYTPRPGDITICLYCGELCILGPGLKRRIPTPAEAAGLAAIPQIAATQQSIKDFIKHRLQ